MHDTAQSTICSHCQEWLNPVCDVGDVSHWVGKLMWCNG
jgi:hypothetical protein